jgi:hypothetical protein
MPINWKKDANYLDHFELKPLNDRLILEAKVDEKVAGKVMVYDPVAGCPRVDLGCNFA